MAERRAQGKPFAVPARPTNNSFRLLVDTSPDPCVVGLRLGKHEVEDRRSWCEGTRFLEVRQGVVWEWRQGPTGSVLVKAGSEAK